MLFHRNPWKDPTPGDPNFDNFLHDPTGFLLSKFTGIGREVASYLADHVLCTEVEARVGARQFGLWIKTLPDMIGGRKAMNQLKMARLDHKTPTEKGMFVKSPIEPTHERGRKPTTSALTSSAPVPAAFSQLPPPSQFSSHASTLPTPDLDRDDVMSATTIDDQHTPVDMADLPSPDSVDAESSTPGDPDSRSLSTHKRRKRGMRKGKAAQAALAAASAGENERPSQEERDSLLAELAAASQSLARDLSKNRNHPDFDVTRVEDFPPLGTSPAQVAAAKKSKWKDLMKMSSGNPELAALARRVAERDASTGGNWSAPAMLQHDANRMVLSKPVFKHTVTMSSGISSALSSFGPVSSATSSSGGVEEEDWRMRDKEDRMRGRERVHEQTSKRKDDSSSRARQAAVAAAAITGNMEPMGSFGKGPVPPRSAASADPPLKTSYTARHSAPIGAQIGQQRSVPRSNLALQPVVIVEDQYQQPSKVVEQSIPTYDIPKPVETFSSSSSRPSLTSTTSSNTIIIPAPLANPSTPPGQSPNKPKLKGQIQSLAKMLSGLKTKGKDQAG